MEHERLATIRRRVLVTGVVGVLAIAVAIALVVFNTKSAPVRQSAKAPLQTTPAATTAGSSSSFRSRFVVCDDNAFFGSRTSLTAITARMGALVLCGRATDGNQWVLVFGGEHPNPAANFRTGSTPGGPPLYLPAPFGGWSIATLTCTGSQGAVSACPDPSSTHDFRQFTVHLPPVFGYGFEHLPTLTQIYGTTAIAFQGAICGVVVFNVPNDTWYGQPPGNPTAAIAELQSGSTLAMPHFAPQPLAMTGAVMLAKFTIGTVE